VASTVYSKNIDDCVTVIWLHEQQISVPCVKGDGTIQNPKVISSRMDDWKYSYMKREKIQTIEVVHGLVGDICQSIIPVDTLSFLPLGCQLFSKVWHDVPIWESWNEDIIFPHNEKFYCRLSHFESIQKGQVISCISGIWHKVDDDFTNLTGYLLYPTENTKYVMNFSPRQIGYSIGSSLVFEEECATTKGQYLSLHTGGSQLGQLWSTNVVPFGYWPIIRNEMEVKSVKSVEGKDILLYLLSVSYKKGFIKKVH